MSIDQISTCSVCRYSSTYSMTKIPALNVAATTRAAGTWRCILSRTTTNTSSSAYAFLLLSPVLLLPFYTRGGSIVAGFRRCTRIPAKSLQPAEPLSLSLNATRRRSSPRITNASKWITHTHAHTFLSIPTKIGNLSSRGVLALSSINGRLIPEEGTTAKGERERERRRILGSCQE